MKHSFKTKIHRKGKQKEVEISFDYCITESGTLTKDVQVFEDGKEIKNYSIPAVIYAIDSFLWRLPDE